MKRVLIFLILTLACAFGSYTSFMSNDYGPLKHWMAYYKEYKEIQGALDKGNASKAELLAKLKAMYPEKRTRLKPSSRRNTAASRTRPKMPATRSNRSGIPIPATTAPATAAPNPRAAAASRRLPGAARARTAAAAVRTAAMLATGTIRQTATTTTGPVKSFLLTNNNYPLTSELKSATMKSTQRGAKK